MHINSLRLVRNVIETVGRTLNQAIAGSGYAGFGLIPTVMGPQRPGQRHGGVVVGTEARDPSQKSETVSECGLALMEIGQIGAARLRFFRSFYSLAKPSSFPSLGDDAQPHGEPGPTPWPACYP
jgi:hypothetical protein